MIRKKVKTATTEGNQNNLLLEVRVETADNEAEVESDSAVEVEIAETIATETIGIEGRDLEEETSGDQGVEIEGGAKVEVEIVPGGKDRGVLAKANRETKKNPKMILPQAPPLPPPQTQLST